MYKIQDFTIPELLEKSSAQYASRPALGMVGAQPISFADLEPLTRHVGSVLRAWGIAKDDKVTILAESSPSWGIGYLGTSRIGAILVPILVDFTPEQINNIILHSESRLVLASEKAFPKLQKGGITQTILDIQTLEPLQIGQGAQAPSLQAIQDAKDAFIPSPVARDDIAMIVYTSGTTGLSKGVCLSHYNIVWDAWACKSIIVLNRRDRLLSILPLAHTYEFTIGFIIPLMMGSFVQYLDRPPAPTVLLPALKAVRPTIMLSVPLVIEKVYRASIQPTLEGMKAYSNPVLRPLLEKFAGFKLKKTFGGKLRFFGVGGAPLSPEVEGFLKRAGFPYAIGYGLTETAPLIAGCNPQNTFVRSTGPALKGVSIRIADPRPDSGEGEIQAKGPNVFKEYYKDPERSAEAFTADGWFRTGDLGYIDARQRVFVRGRLKTMIVGSSGENIYPEEIEAVLNGSPEVAESLVYGSEDGLTALVYLKSEVLENLEARVRDSIEGAGETAASIGQAVGGAVSGVAEAASHLLEKIRREANARLSAFSRIKKVEMQQEPFEKTPTQKIKRFLYPSKETAQETQATDDKKE